MSQCTFCGQDATKWCSGCINAPIYKAGESTAPTFFCSRKCQLAFWPMHKQICQMKRKRKALLRAGLLLKTAMIEYKRAFYYHGITGVETKGNTIIVNHDPSQRGHHRFPDVICNNTEQEEAVLLTNQCDAAMCLLRRMTEKLLEGVYEYLDDVPVTIPKARLDVEFDPPPQVKNRGHYIIKARIKVDGMRAEDWAIDISGAQYGFGDVLCPFEEYLEDHECRELPKYSDEEDGGNYCHDAEEGDMVTNYDNGLTYDIDEKEWSWAKHGEKCKMDFGVERECRKHFEATITAHARKRWTRGRDAQFAQKLADFEAVVKYAMSCKVLP